MEVWAETLEIVSYVEEALDWVKYQLKFWSPVFVTLVLNNTNNKQNLFFDEEILNNRTIYTKLCKLTEENTEENNELRNGITDKFTEQFRNETDELKLESYLDFFKIFLRESKHVLSDDQSRELQEILENKFSNKDMYEDILLKPQTPVQTSRIPQTSDTSEAPAETSQIPQTSDTSEASISAITDKMNPALKLLIDAIDNNVKNPTEQISEDIKNLPRNVFNKKFQIIQDGKTLSVTPIEYYYIKKDGKPKGNNELITILLDKSYLENLTLLKYRAKFIDDNDKNEMKDSITRKVKKRERTIFHAIGNDIKGSYRDYVNKKRAIKNNWLGNGIG